MRGSKNTPRSLIIIILLACAGTVLLALISALSPILAIVVLAGLLGTLLLLPRAATIVGVFSAATFFEVVVFGPGLTPVKLLGGLIVTTAILHVILGADQAEVPPWRGSVYMLGIASSLVIWAVASLSWATDTSQVESLSFRLLLDVLVFACVPVLVRTTTHLRSVGWWCAGGALAGALLGIAAGHQLYGRATGMFSDPNEFASATVVAAVFALVLGESDRRSAMHWGGRLITIGLLIAIASSASRTGMLGIVLAYLVLVVTARGLERIRLTGMLALATALVLAWLMFTPSGALVGERFKGENSTGRTDLWKVARYQFESEPVHGVGLGNYPVRSAEFLRRDVQNIDLFIRAPRTVHNTPLELLAELGLVGFLLFYSLVGACLFTGYRGLRIAKKLNQERLVGVCRAILASLVALLGASLTLSALYVELQWVLMGCCVASYVVARNAHAQQINKCKKLEIGDLMDATAGSQLIQELPGVTL